MFLKTERPHSKAYLRVLALALLFAASALLISSPYVLQTHAQGPVSTFGSAVTMQDEGAWYCGTSDSVQFPNCVNPVTPSGVPDDVYEFRLIITPSTPWYIHIPMCNCTITDNTPLLTAYHPVGNVLTIDGYNNTNGGRIPIYSIVFNSTTGVQTFSIFSLPAQGSGVVMSFLYDSSIQAGETFTFTPYVDGNYVADTSGSYTTYGYVFSYLVSGSTTLTGSSGSTIASSAPGTVLHTWGSYDSYIHEEQLEYSWAIDGFTSGTTSPAFILELKDFLMNNGERVQLGGVLWFSTLTQQDLGINNSAAFFQFAPQKGCAKFNLNVPTALGNLMGTLSGTIDSGGGCPYSHGSVTGTLSLGSTKYTVEGVGYEYRCTYYNGAPAVPGCGNGPISTTTATACAPSSVTVGVQTTCTATVLSSDPNLAPSGNVTFSTSPAGSGVFSSSICYLSPVVGITDEGECQVGFTPSFGSEGTDSITSSYGGNFNYGVSSASTGVTASVRTSSTVVSCLSSSVPVGSETTCTATVSDTSPGIQLTPSGTVSFSGTPNTGGGFVPTSCTLLDGSCSTAFTAAASSGAFSGTAAYSGDQDHSLSSGIFQIDLAPTSPSLSGTLSQGSVTADESVSDAATLSGATGTAGGTVTFYYSTADSCPTSGAVEVGSPVAVSGNGQYQSASTTFTSTGTYYWYAVYSGDANNNGVTSSCQALAVTQAPTFLSTQLSTSPITVGGSVSDSATLSGATTSAGGTVTFYYSETDSCPFSGASQFGSPVPVSGPGTYSTPTPDTLSSTGTYYWYAVYSGDANNLASTSPCETLVVTQATPTVALSISSSSIMVGGSISASGSLIGAFSGAGGSVTYSYYTSASCSGTAITLAIVSVESGSVPGSGSQTFNNAGTYFLVASYSGDSNDMPAVSPCGGAELSVTPAVPSIASSLSSGSIMVQGSVSDAATLSGATGTAGGTVTFYYSTADSCPTSGAVEVGSPVAVSGNGQYQSASTTFTSTGTYYWYAVYSGDANNNGVTSSCEPLVVSIASPTVSTSLSMTSIYASSSVFDTATLSGENANAGGTVTYYYFSSSTCSGTKTVVGSAVSVVNGVIPNSASHKFTAAGSYGWEAVYSGDSEDQGTTSPCEPLSVLPLDSIGLTPSTTTQTAGNTMQVAYTATVTGLYPSSPAPAGTVTWSDGGKGGTFTAATCTLSSTSSDASQCGVSYTPSPSVLPGTIKITATYTGDSTHPRVSATATITIARRTTTTKVSASPTSVGPGGQTTLTVTVTDTSSVGSSSPPSGTITLKASVTGGTFGTCTLQAISGSTSQSQCTVSYTAPPTAGSVTISAQFSPGASDPHSGSTGGVKLTVT